MCSLSVFHHIWYCLLTLYIDNPSSFINCNTSSILSAVYVLLCVVHFSIARSKRDGTRAETRFGLSAKRPSPFKSAGVSVQSTAGSRGVQISGQQLYRPGSDIQWKAAGYPLHSHLSPSLPLSCVTVCHQIPNALYHLVVQNSQYTTTLKNTKKIACVENYWSCRHTILLHDVQNPIFS